MHEPMNNSSRSRRQAGFTLVEIMVVIVIIGLLATIVAPNVLGLSDDAKIEKAKADIRVIADTVKIYLVQGRGAQLPTMETLTTPDEKGKVWLDSISDDPWGNEYQIREGERRGDFEVVSSGPDGSEGTEDDLSSKSMNKKD